ncbi:hypothetical protein [Burkholderia sp. TSV86]|uniref:hypothetical protein n=1 Tax=Burkholderia sp. TSV86 TaxID=1385594 RepID=UPI0009EC29BB|nr:hypothetical protein [Burkholderia sp. TSV86]
MATSFRLYRGLEIYPLVYPCHTTEPGYGHNYDEGFNAAVRIQEPGNPEGSSRSRVFQLPVAKPFLNAGDARRASTAYAEHLIDTCSQDTNVLDLEL